MKSTSRVRDLGEVFTPASIVKAMLDLLPDDMWLPHPVRTFLEPACGTGNFLVAIFERKANRVVDAWEAGTLPAGTDADALLFHLLEALSSIYGIDISPENIEGSPDFSLGARPRLLSHFHRRAKRALGRALASNSHAVRAAEWIIEQNLVVGNTLGADGTGRHPDVQFVEFEWDPELGTVSTLSTTLQDALEGAANEREDTQLSMFGGLEPTKMWEGKANRLHESPGRREFS